MSTYGPIAYEDMALLNAQWQQARPPMAGLGSVYGQHEYRDLSYLNARLRPILPATVGMPPGTDNGSLSGNSIGTMAGLGADPSYPWMANSPDTKALQDQINIALQANGYAPITADGTLGPATCGAVQTMCGLVSPPCTVPSTCQGFTPPTKLGGGGSALPSSASASVFGGGGGTNWMLWGGAIAAIAVGGALMLRASKKR